MRKASGSALGARNERVPIVARGSTCGAMRLALKPTGELTRCRHGDRACRASAPRRRQDLADYGLRCGLLLRSGLAAAAHTAEAAANFVAGIHDLWVMSLSQRPGCRAGVSPGTVNPWTIAGREWAIACYAAGTLDKPLHDLRRAAGVTRVRAGLPRGQLQHRKAQRLPPLQAAFKRADAGDASAL